MTIKSCFLLFDNSDAHVEDQFLACKNCNNKTFTLKYQAGSDYPHQYCAACNAFLGLVGWADPDE